MSFFELLKQLFGSTVLQGRSGGTDSSGNGGSVGETAVEMIPCDEASARLFEYLDGELGDLSEEEVRRHLGGLRGLLSSRPVREALPGSPAAVPERWSSVGELEGGGCSRR